jgi:hypothetical protein
MEEALPLLAALFTVPIIVKKQVFQEFAVTLGFLIMLSFMFTGSFSSSVEYLPVSFFTVFPIALIYF